MRQKNTLTKEGVTTQLTPSFEHPATLTLEPPPQGKLIVLTGPSGVGKGTLVKALLERHPELHLSVSATTRQPRPGEVEGKHYFFLERSHFQQMVAAGEFLEWAEYAGNLYGTPRQNVEQQIARGQIVLLEIELVGARLIQQTFPKAFRIFILPPSSAELERRLRDRGQDSEEAIVKRLGHAEAEIAASHEFDLQVVNDNLESALAKLEKAILGQG
ncbi:guanylate kinase [Spirulina subsalsa]|uniref:guanylate kinase n=1 Tax=Spirulina subsalsa TaxID=54311 RepID=UPI0002F00176|nr:guanylate kinase [Spirulina subsalsa]